MNTLVFTLGEHRSQLTLKISTYPNGNLAIKLYEKDHGILIFWDTFTQLNQESGTLLHN